ncbi:hypothetical protein HPB51_022779 [Rhipicephalus microplus]|uniref:C2H2-type domain-containing protein n=1 Tax=Rhipicephalus microplus TaxID=6941 RepID=A0A9J6ECV8_RHIMP|nr:hypothetical protein HPB51_022779 [Rhipicephalus microplus]
MERAAGKMPSQPRSCKECCMQFTGPVPYLDHMQSAKHKKKMATLNQTDAPAAPVDTRVVGPVKSTSILRHPLPFSCKLCNVSMNCEAALTAHNKTFNFLVLKYYSETCATNPANSVFAEASRRKVRKKSP